MALPVAVGFLGTPSVPEMVRLARNAEEAGFSSIWVAETRFRRDAVSAAAAILAVTRRMRVATGLINVYTRNPVLIAAQAGFSSDAISAIQRATHAAGPEAGASHVTPEMVDALCVAGTAEECHVGVERFRAAGLALPILMTPDDPETLVETFGSSRESDLSTRLSGGV